MPEPAFDVELILATGRTISCPFSVEAILGRQEPEIQNLMAQVPGREGQYLAVATLMDSVFDTDRFRISDDADRSWIIPSRSVVAISVQDPLARDAGREPIGFRPRPHSAP